MERGLLSPMLRSLAAFLVAALLTALVVGVTAVPATPLWTAPVSGMGAGFLAATVVAMQESLIEDGLKGAIFTFLGGALLLLDLPGWVCWPLVVGPWVGFVGNRGRSASPPERDG